MAAVLGGEILRHMGLAKELCQAIFGGALPGSPDSDAAKQM
jgi:hypothetical protein